MQWTKRYDSKWLQAGLALLLLALFLGSLKGVSSVSKAAPPAAKVNGIVGPHELATVIDLSKVPSPKDTKFNKLQPSGYEALVPLPLDKAFEFYLTKLAALGLQVSSEPNSKQVYEGSASAALVKDGHRAYLTIYDSGDKGKSSVSIIRHGNLDAKTLPRSAGAKSLYDGPGMGMYVAKGSVADEVKFVDAALRKAGWQAYVRPNTAFAENPDQWMADYRNRGYSLGIMISKAPAQNNQTVVQYSLTTLSHELPAPADAEPVEYVDADWVLNCKISGDLDVAEKFYTTAMPAAGYKPLPHNEATETHRSLRYETPEKGLVLITLQNKDGKTTSAKFLHVSAEMLAKLNEPKPEKPATTDAPTEPQAAAISARSLPLPKFAKDVDYDAAGEKITFKAGGSIAELTKALRADFGAADWKELKAAATADANTATLHFEQGDANVTFVVFNLGLGGANEVMVTTSGLNWKQAEQE